MKINFTKKQFTQLLDLLYLGEWTANSSRSYTERHTGYDELVQYVYAFAKEMGQEEKIIFDKQSNEYFPTQEYEKQLQPIIDENDNDVFWQELSMRLSQRDLAKGEKVLKDQEERTKRLFELDEYYEEEFVNNGLARLVVKEDAD